MERPKKARKREMNNKESGLSVWGVVQIIFLILKLTKLVDWSWKWVLAPSWIWLILVVIFCIYLWNKV